MELLNFLRRIDDADRRILVILTIVSALANALLLVCVNGIAGLFVLGHRPGLLGALIFIGIFLTYYLANRYALLRANRVIEEALRQIRLRLVDKLRRAELLEVDRLGRGRLITALAEDTNHLSIAFPLIVDAAQQSILLVVCLVYLSLISLASLLLFLGAVAAGFAGYMLLNKRIGELTRRVSTSQVALLDVVKGVIRGAKELRLNRRKSAEVFRRCRQLSKTTERLLLEAGKDFAGLLLIVSMVTYLMLGVAIFLFPLRVSNSGKLMLAIIPVLLFLMASLSRVVAQSPMFVRAEIGLASIATIDAELDDAMRTDPEAAREKASSFGSFERINFTDIRFRHRDAKGDVLFQSGPWSLHLQRGEILFLVGGNGSGKSTALRLITGLYPADSGQISVDDRVVDAASVPGLREQFSAIWGNFHLFDRLYGVENAPVAEVERLIEQMGLAGKVKFHKGRFSTRDLSTGQRKRLALIAALLEDRPILAFDEWSAEQDVHFREQFYHQILPDLKRRGKTVVAITHDERFWGVADRVIRFELGRVQ
jgi:putative ATP-binding cassette transporter